MDELSQTENMQETLPGNDSQSEPEESEKKADADNQVDETEESSAANARIMELEESITGKDSEIFSLKMDKSELEDRLSDLNNSLTEAIASYKAMAVNSNPEIMEDLISGDTIESINESLDRAKALISRVRQGVEADISQTKVPAGAPERTPPDLSVLSPREKIQFAIGGLSYRS